MLVIDSTYPDYVKWGFSGLEIRNLSFQGNLVLYKNKLNYLIGPNGIGKTTFFNLMVTEMMKHSYYVCYGT